MTTRSWAELKDSPMEQDYCKELYYSGEGWTQRKLAELYGVSYSSMQKFIQKKGWVKKRNLDKRKFEVNDDFFAEQNHVMAYWLGFIAADGYLPKSTNEVGIGLSIVDKEHLEKFSKDIGLEKDVKCFTTSNGFESCKVVFTSKKMRDDLKKYSIVPEKTFKLEWPELLDKEYMIDYIRGYFDGDGSISLLQNGAALRWQICGAKKDFLEKIVDFLYEEYNIPKASVLCDSRHGKRLHPLYYFQYSTVSTQKIYNILYPEGHRYLSRKKKHFDEIIDQARYQVCII